MFFVFYFFSDKRARTVAARGLVIMMETTLSP
jgi:hypothetical protein